MLPNDAQRKHHNALVIGLSVASACVLCMAAVITIVYRSVTVSQQYHLCAYHLPRLT